MDRSRCSLVLQRRYLHMADKPCTELPNPEAAVLPALVSVFDSEVTLLGHFIHSAFADKNEQWPGPRGYVLSSDKPYFPS